MCMVNHGVKLGFPHVVGLRWGHIEEEVLCPHFHLGRGLLINSHRVLKLGHICLKEFVSLQNFSLQL
jgi:hypothetical protein